MRNLKRALSLGLTATMISGLMVMGSSAASYADVTSENHQEAIEVLKSVGIMTGDEKGNFNPEAKVTRNEMAVVMSNLMAYNVKTYANTSPFTDVPEWAEPYVAACYTNGITAGYTANTYGGSDNVTTAQAALMVMKALGYFQFQSDFGADWQLSTVAQGNKIDLFEDVDSPVKEAITRNELAQLVLNALESGTVEADDDTIKVNADGVTVEAGKVKYNFITSTKDYAKAIKEVRSTSDTSDAGSYVVELGEKLYDGDLTKDRTGDDFGRPSNKWEYQAKEVGTYPDSADHTFTAKVTSKALYNAIGKTAAENYDMNVYFNGEPVDKYGKGDLYKNKADDDSDFVAYADAAPKAMTANGVITEVFVDGTDEVVTVAIMEQYAAEVLKVDEEDGTITLSDLSREDKADAKDEFETTEFAEDDVVIYTYANDKIQSVYAAEKIEGDVTSVRVDTKTNDEGKNTFEGDGDNFTVDGTTYKYNKTMVGDEKLQTENVNNGVVAYLDAQGYVAYIDESAVSYDYAYVLSMGSNNNQYGGSDTYYARLVLTDGTMIKVETDADDNKLVGHIVSYSKDKKDVYSLSDRSDKEATDGRDALHAAPSLEINNGKASFKAETKEDGKPALYTANANTIFIVADSDPDYDDYDYTVYTGVKNVPDIDAVNGGETEAVVAVREGNVAKVVYIEDADVSGAGDVIFVKADTNPKYTKDQDGKIFELDAIIGGEAKTLKIKEGSTAAKRLITDIANSTKGFNLPLNDEEYLVALKGITENADGYVTSVRLYNEDGKTGDLSGIITGVGILDKSKNDIVTLGGNGTYTWADDVVVAQFNDKSNKGEFESSKISSLKEDKNDLYIAVLDENVITGICTVFVDDDDKAPEGGVTSGIIKNKVANVDSIDAGYTISKTGKMTIDFTVDVPEYVPDNAVVSVTGDLYIDGDFDGPLSMTSATGGTVKNGKATIRVTGSNYDHDWKLTLDNVAVSYDKVIVKYVDGDGKALSMKAGTTATATLPVTGTIPAPSAVALKFNLNDRVYNSADAGTVAIDGATTNATTTSVTPGTEWNTAGSETFLAKGDGYVTVKVTGLKAAAENYVLASTLTGDKAAAVGGLTTTAGTATAMNKLGLGSSFDDTLKFETDLTTATGLANNKLITFKVTAAQGGSAWEANRYTVTLVTDKGDLTFEVGGSVTTDTAEMRINGADITVTDVKVEVKTPLLAVKSVTKVNDYTVEVKFNQGVAKTSNADLTKTEVAGTSGTSTYTLTHTAGKDTVTLAFSDNLVNGATVVLDYDGILSSIENSNHLPGASDITYTYNATTGEFTTP